MEFKFHEIDTLPMLSWYAQIQRASSVIEVFHGTGVDTREDRFHEGAWSGPFETGAIDEAPVVAGSGMKLVDGDVLLITPSHPSELLYSARRAGALHVSNSLVFLSSALGEVPDSNYPNYCFDHLESTRRGATRRPVSSPMQGGSRVDFLMMRNYVISSDLRVKSVPKSKWPKPRDFEQYYNSMKSSLEAVMRNAASPNRRLPLRPITTVSEGYDSTAVAALSASLGCQEAITFQSKLEDGSEIGTKLGLKVTAYRRDEVRSHDGLIEAEFCAIPLGSCIPFAKAEKQLTGSLLMTGYMGEEIWSKSLQILKSGRMPFERLPGVGRSLSEFRLRVGFSSLPVPMIGIMRSLEIHKISNSLEMKPWQLGVEYDRPIPRRIIEEAGIPRSMFGTKKQAGGHLYPWQEEAMSEAGRADFSAFFNQIPEKAKVRRHPKWFRFISNFHGRISQAFRLLPSKLSPFYLPITQLRFRNAQHYFADSPHLFTCHWGMNRIRHRYRLPHDLLVDSPDLTLPEQGQN